jgi:flagellin-like protein
MRTLRRSRRGISEIVGALMLVLIVVVAATSLAVYVAQYQKQLQSEQALTHDRALEKLAVLHVTPYLPLNSTTWYSLNFTVASLYINPSIVDEITLNDQAVKQYTVWALNLTSGTFTSIVVGGGGQLTLSPNEQVNVNLTTNLTSPDYSFYSATFVLPLTAYLKLDLFTGYQNDFTRVFIPPTAVAVVSPLETFSAGNFTTIPVLDGSNSFQAGNASLDAWAWFVTPGPIRASGEKAVVAFSTTPGTTYTILLAVTNTDGLLGTDTITYTTP